MNRVDNLNAGRGARAATVIVPSVLLILGTSGVVAKPTLGLETARRQRGEAAVREHEFEFERVRAAQFERRGGIQRIEAARATIENAVPARMSALDLQNILVLVAAKNHLELQTIEIGSPIETTFATLGDRITASPANLRGRGALGDFVAFVDGVQLLGLAASVSECRVARTSAGDPQFEFRLTLNFHHRDALLHAPDDQRAGGP